MIDWEKKSSQMIVETKMKVKYDEWEFTISLIETSILIAEPQTEWIIYLTTNSVYF